MDVRHLILGLLLTVVTVAPPLAGCIPPSSDYPYRPPDEVEDVSSPVDDTGATDTGDAGDDTAGPCIPETNAEFCDRVGAQCGELTANDNCGEERTVSNCGNCDEGDCIGNACNCIPESSDEFCQRKMATCGMVKDDDNCGILREVSCGTCGFGANCEDGACVCPGGDEEMSCGDDEDNDCDGKIDCDDPNCEGRNCGTLSECESGVCKAL